MKHPFVFPFIVIMLVVGLGSMAIVLFGAVLATNSPVEMTRSDLKLLESTNSMIKSEILGEILFGVVRYTPDLGELLYARYQTEPNAGVRMAMLAVLDKHQYRFVSTLLEEARASTNRAERDVAAYIDSGAYSNAMATEIDDPTVLCTRVKQHLQHLDTLAESLWPETLFMLRYNAKACGYDEKVGDALAKFFLEHPAADLFGTRVGISFVLLNQNHPMLPKLLEKLKKSDNPDDRELAHDLESNRKAINP